MGRLAELKKNNTKVGVAIISQVSSWPAILLPVADLVALLKAEGIPSIVDGAHVRPPRRSPWLAGKCMEQCQPE